MSTVYETRISLYSKTRVAVVSARYTSKPYEGVVHDVEDVELVNFSDNRD